MNYEQTNFVGCINSSLGEAADMTTKQVFLDVLTARYTKVGPPILQTARSIPGMNIYSIPTFRVTAGDVALLNVTFAVQDEGEVTEAAYWLPTDPDLIPSGRQFANDVQDFITAKIADGTIKAGWVSRVNEFDETAEVWAMLVDDVDQLTDVKVLLFRSGGVINFRLVDNVISTTG